MITLAKLSLSPLVNIQVNLSAKSAARKGFNVALIMGSSKVIPKEERVRIYTGAEAMLEDGFTVESPEYKAALLYFSSRLAPTKLAVGLADANAVSYTHLEQLEEILKEIWDDHDFILGVKLSLPRCV